MGMSARPLLNTAQMARVANQQRAHNHGKPLRELVPDAVQLGVSNSASGPASAMGDFEGNIIQNAGAIGMYGGFAWMAHFAVPHIGSWISKLIGFGGKGATAMGITSVAGGLQGTSKFIANTSEAYTKRRLGEFKIGNTIAIAANAVSSPVYTAFRKFDELTGLPSMFASKAATRSESYANLAQAHIEKLGNLHPEVAGAVHRLTQIPFGNSELLNDAGDQLKKAIEGRGLPKPTRKAIDKIQSLVGQSHHFADKSVGWTEIATGNHNTFADVKNASLHHSVSNGLLSATSIASVVGTTAETISDVKVFRQIVADSTGKDVSEVNSGDALFATLPFAGEVARRAMVTSAAPRAILEGVNTVFNIKMIKGRDPGFITMLIPAAISQAIGQYTAGNILDVYKGMKKNEMTGQENMPDQYAALIGMSHKGLSKRGGNSSNFAQELGRMYAERHATVREVLQAIGNGQIDKEIQLIVAHNEAAAQADKAPVLHTHAAPEAAPAASLNQVDAVEANALAKPFKSVVDRFEKSADFTFADRFSAGEHTPQPVRQ